jgi:hypothetical protein
VGPLSGKEGAGPLITFDDSMWPLLNVTFTGASSNEEFEAYLATLTKYRKRKERYLTIFDSRVAAAPSLHQRQRQVEWLKSHESETRQLSLGSAFVITSPLIRLAMNIIYQLRPPPNPYHVVGDIEVARAWAADRFHQAGLSAPAMLIRNHYGLAGGNKVAGTRVAGTK